MEERLEKTSKRIGIYSLLACLLCIAANIIFLMLFLLISQEHDIFSNFTLLKLVKIGIISLVLLIVSIPEGLPMAVSIAMALSIDSLKRDEILIKNLESV